ncbi:MAG: GNAT family N-acetyltransferase [Hyphomicrobiaceae bacterium]
MIDDLTIRKTEAGDLAAIEALYRDAFPEEDLLPLVSELMQTASIALSLAATVGSSLVGHIVLSRCELVETKFRVALLGPLCVASTWRKMGIGGTLVRNGLQLMDEEGMVLACVLGDPAYYGRFGFSPEKDVRPPYPLPDAWCAAWQSIKFGQSNATYIGQLVPPEPWQRPAFWAP